MTGNRAVTYQGPMKVMVEDIDYPTFELKDGPGVNPATSDAQSRTAPS